MRALLQIWTTVALVPFLMAAADAKPQLTINLSPSSDSGLSRSDGVTRVRTPLLTGTAEPHQKVEVVGNGRLLGSAVTDADGIWTLTTRKLKDGTYTFIARAGKVTSPTLQIVIDTEPPSIPELEVDWRSAITEVPPYFTKPNPVLRENQLRGGAKLAILYQGGKEIGRTAAAAWGFAFRMRGAEHGAHSVSAKVLDLAGNASKTAEPLSFTIIGRRRTVELSEIDGRNGFRLDGNARQTELGYAIASAGDVNGDGLGDIVVGTGHVGGSGDSTAYVVFGSKGEWPSARSIAKLDGRGGFRIGLGKENAAISVAGAGDVNGDGYDDVIVGNPSAGIGGGGQAYVIFGRRTGFPPVVHARALTGRDGFTLAGPYDSYSAFAVAGAGDVNGDGFDDVAISAPFDWDPTIYVFYGRKAHLPTSLKLADLGPTDGFRITDSAWSSNFGAALSSGDVNGDGLSDIVIGAPAESLSSSNVFVVFGAKTRADDRVGVRSLRPGEGFSIRGAKGTISALGRSVSVGDFDDDGYADVAMTGYGAAGAVVFGSRKPSSPVLLEDMSAGEGFLIHSPTGGASRGGISLSGDVNGDGFADVAIDATERDESPHQAAGYVIFGRKRREAPAFYLQALSAADGFRIERSPARNPGIDGLAFAGAGDVNGDRIDDLLIGDPNAATGSLKRAGAAYVLFGTRK